MSCHPDMTQGKNELAMLKSVHFQFYPRDQITWATLKQRAVVFHITMHEQNIS